jgi:cell division protein FtsQ
VAGPPIARRGATTSSPSGVSPEPGPGARFPRLGLSGRGTLIVSLVAFAVLVAGGAWMLYGSAWLRVEKVGASGTRVLTPREVVEAADIPMNMPLASVDTEGVEDRLRAKLPRIASVAVERVWPDEIALKVVERKPEVLLKKGGKFIEVDRESVRFATVGQPPKGVPVLELDASRSPSLKRFGAARLQREAVRVAAGLAERIHRRTQVIRVRSYDSITLELTGGRTVVWGSSERTAAKSRVLLALMKTAKEARYFDVRAPSAPAATGS